ncbi:hypothetical protein BV510_28135, partial [Mycolicibacterium diernhoferi]
TFWQYRNSCATSPGLGCYNVRDPLDLALVAAATAGACIGFLCPFGLTPAGAARFIAGSAPAWRVAAAASRVIPGAGLTGVRSA